MIAKAVGHDNYILEKLRTYCLELLDLNGKDAHTELINLGECTATATHNSNPLLSFLYGVYLSLLSRSPAKYTPSVTQFCLSLLKHTHE